MNESANEKDTGGAGKNPGGQPRPTGLLGAVVLLAVIAAAIWVWYTPKPSVQEDPQTVALREGVAAFHAGAFDAALEKLKPLAEKNNAQAAYWLGQMYEDGLGVNKDADTAISWYRKSAEGGWTDASFRLGEIYLNGTEELQDFKKARKWLEQAARGGNARAQFDLGRLYANGWGGEKDPIQAYVWYEFAAKQGDYEAQRLRDALLKAMQENEIAEAQDLSKKMASQVFGEGKNETKDGKAQTETSNK